MTQKQSSSLNDEIKRFQNQFLILNNQNESTEWIQFVPIRHHSPACAIHVRKMITDYKPDVILVEGPSDANHLISVIQNKEIKTPVAIIDYFKDDKNQYELNGVITPAEEVPFKFYSTYPFIEFSPEFQAIVNGGDLEIPVYFIDIGLDKKLTDLKDRIKDKNNPERDKIISKQLWSDYHFTNNNYITSLVKNSSCRDFNEFWFNFFEIDSVRLTAEEFFTKLFTFGTITRKLTPDEILSADGTLLREDFMLNQIIDYKGNYKKILVITGAFHTLPLLIYDYSKKTKKPKSIKESSTVMVTPYSYYELSEISGYQSGINYPNFCHQVFKEMSKGNSTPFAPIVNNILSLTTKTNFSTYYAISTADIISAYHLAFNLASLRGREDLSPYDMFDAIQSSFIKEELTAEIHPVLKQVELFLTGTAVGYVPSDIIQLPVERDFYEQLRKLKLPQESEEKTVKCEIYNRDLHRTKSRFLWQTVLLGIPYAVLKTGPNYVENQSLWLLTEQWLVKWNKEMSFKFSDIAPYGTTIESASLTFFKELLEKSLVNKDNALFGRYLIKCVQMGHFTMLDDLLDLFQDKIETSSFIDLMLYLKTLVVLYGFRDSLIPPENKNIQGYIQNNYIAVIQCFSTFSDINDDLLNKFTDSMRLLSQLLNDPLLSLLDKQALFSILKYVINDDNTSAKLLGVYYGFLYSFGEVSISDIESEFNTLVTMIHTDQNQPVFFLEGLLSLTKKVLFSGSILNILVRTVNTISEEKFLQLLPGLRRIFTTYMPKESYDLANMISDQIGKENDVLQKEFVLSPESIINLSKFDSEVKKILIDWKLV